jgi:hypothetical protein
LAGRRNFDRDIRDKAGRLEGRVQRATVVKAPGFPSIEPLSVPQLDSPPSAIICGEVYAGSFKSSAESAKGLRRKGLLASLKFRDCSKPNLKLNGQRQLRQTDQLARGFELCSGYGHLPNS